MTNDGIQFLIICIAMAVYYWLLTSNMYDIKKELKMISKKIDELKEKQKMRINEYTPTDKQLKLIKDITDELGVKFNGSTKEDARKFISEHIYEYQHSRDEVLGWGEMNGY